MPRSHWSALGIGVAGILATAFAWWARTDDASGIPDIAVRWREHTTYRYAVDYEQQHRLTTGGPGSGLTAPIALAVDTDLDATVEVEWRGRIADRVVLALRFAEIDHASVTLGGSELLPDRDAVNETLLGHELLFEIAADGEVAAIHVDPDDPELFSNLARILVGELQVRTAGAVETWSATEHDGLGTAQVDYALASVDDGVLSLQKRRDRYTAWAALPAMQNGASVDQDLSHEAAIDVSRAGDLRRVVGEQILDASDERGSALDVRTKVQWDLLALVPAAPRREPIAERLAMRRSYRPDEVLDSPLAERNLLEQQAGGLTWSQLRGGVLDFGAGDVTSPAYADLAWQAKALLELDPSLCDQLVPLFVDASADIHRRGFILDLLGHVEHEHAQVAMLAMLRSDVARVDPDDEARLVQRLGLVAHPSAETTAYVQASLRDAIDPDLVTASAYTLGAVVARLDDDAAAIAANSILTEMLTQTTDAAGRAIAARALGNTRRADNVELLVAAAHDEDRDVRLAVADSLSRFDATAARAALVALASDTDVRIQGRALAGLGRRADAEADREVGESIASGRVSSWNYREALAVLDRIDDDKLRRRALEHMAASSAGDPKVRSAVAKRLQTLGG